jgi:predicted transcriptional regulator
MAAVTNRKYMPRFRRVPQARISLQKRDREIFKHVYKHRFLNSDHIAALVPGGDQAIRRRLKKLFHAGYLDRPREQVRPFRKGNYPYVYGLGDKAQDIDDPKGSGHRWP